MMCALLTASAVCSAESPAAIYFQYNFDSDTAGSKPSGISVNTKWKNAYMHNEIKRF